MNTIYDIYISGKYFGNIQARTILEAAPLARMLINQSNPKIFVTKFTLTGRPESVEFDI